MARRARFERDDSGQRAAILIERRARETAVFQQGIVAAETAARSIMDEMSGLTPEHQVAYLRQRGGWSAIISGAFEAATCDAVVPIGFGQQVPVSTFFDPSDIAAIRIAAQTGR